MASVWVARQSGKHGFEKLVAIKTILPKFATDVRFQEMFLDEARIASRIEHANVAQIFDLGEEHDILYLAMEYVDGDSVSKLNRACQRKGVKIPTGVILRVLADTCAGLNEAHELKDPQGRALEIVHRDVSPHNILVSSKGVAKLIDFGIAKARSRMGSDTNSGVLKGKIAYMAPEQALGQQVDRRADVWAVGAILYHLLAGRPPYEGDNQLATLHLLGSGRPPMPLPSTVHPAISAIVRRALTFDPNGRAATAADMRDAIERAMASASLTTSSADVAAFASEHLADRAEKRRYAIDAALAAAAERKRARRGFRARSRQGRQAPAAQHDASASVVAPVAPWARLGDARGDSRGPRSAHRARREADAPHLGPSASALLLCHAGLRRHRGVANELAAAAIPQGPAGGGGRADRGGRTGRRRPPEPPAPGATELHVERRASHDVEAGRSDRPADDSERSAASAGNGRLDDAGVVVLPSAYGRGDGIAQGERGSDADRTSSCSARASCAAAAAKVDAKDAGRRRARAPRPSRRLPRSPSRPPRLPAPPPPPPAPTGKQKNSGIDDGF